MSRKLPRPIPHFRPVSQRAYDTFVRRIYAVVPMDNRCADMIDALDKYLAGDRESYASHLDEYTAITFEMLRFEIDKAIERSARARRPRHRKAEAEPQVTSVAPDEKKKDMPKNNKADGILPMSDDKVNDPEMPMHTDNVTQQQEGSEPLLPRRIRRAAILAMRPRRKWRKIG
ncbi:MAG: hypothetical protein HDS01_03575 [Bacteroides sp.]|nr:hypothetical protein [Bacteroides sp.]